jgi:hypothetical protein
VRAISGELGHRSCELQIELTRAEIVFGWMDSLAEATWSLPDVSSNKCIHLENSEMTFGKVKR